MPPLHIIAACISATWLKVARTLAPFFSMCQAAKIAKLAPEAYPGSVDSLPISNVIVRISELCVCLYLHYNNVNRRKFKLTC